MGLVKIDDAEITPTLTPNYCTDPEHDVDMSSLEDGEYEYTCPGCGRCLQIRRAGLSTTTYLLDEGKFKIVSPPPPDPLA